MIDIDESTDFGARAAAHLRDDVVVWLTTVSAAGAPLPTPVWFLWDGGSRVHVQSLPGAKRIEHLQANPRLSLNFDGNGQGGDIVVLSGRATLTPATPLPAAYADKYSGHIPNVAGSPEEFGQRYSTGIDIELTRLRGN
ncbi:MAG TPA: pyridoxamine 5'-phosphate oxidase family protein [Baekduia sp.]